MYQPLRVAYLGSFRQCVLGVCVECVGANCFSCADEQTNNRRHHPHPHPHPPLLCCQVRELKSKLETERREDKRAVLQEKVSRNVTKLTAACREREHVSFSGGQKKNGSVATTTKKGGEKHE